MKKLCACFWVVMSGLGGVAHAFDCSDQNRITLEIIEAELSGIRSQASDELPSCFTRKDFKTIRIVHQSSGESHFQKPEYRVPKAATVKILSEPDPAEKRRLVEVRFSYPTLDGKIVQDILLYRRLHSSRVQRRGCAVIQEIPAHFSLREDCTPPAVKDKSSE